MIPRFTAILAAAALIGVALHLHAEQDEPGTSVATATAAAETGPPDDAGVATTNLERYCRLAKRLTLRYFAEAEQGGAAPAEFLRENEALLRELGDVAPASIRPDVEAFIAGTADAGTERRLQDFDRERCRA